MTPRSTERFTIPGPAGKLEVAINAPADRPRGIALVAHPNPQQGGTLDNKVAQTLAKTFYALGYASVRANYRGVGASEGGFDEGIGETDDMLAALAYAQSRFADEGAPIPVVLAGFSFGAYVQTRVAKQVQAERLVLVGPAVGRFPIDPVAEDTVVIHGEQDEVVALDDVLAWARPQQLPVVVFPGGSHFFHGRLLQLQRVITTMWQASARA